MHALIMLLWLLGTPAPFEKDGKWGYRDDNGKVVIPPRYHAAREFSEGIAAVADGNGWAYIDAAGKVVVRPLVVDNGPDDFAEDLARFRRGRKVGFFDRRGKTVIPPDWDFALPFSDGFAAVCRGCSEVKDGEHRSVRGGVWGFIDRRGAVAVPLRFEEAEPFENGRARVRLHGEWREIDRRGRVMP